MQLVNILLSMGLIILILGITVLTACTLTASANGINFLGFKSVAQTASLEKRKFDRRKQENYSFPFSCTDGTTVYVDRRRSQDRRVHFST